MTIQSIGDQARAFAMQAASHRIKTTLATLTTELSSGEVSDISARLGGNTRDLSLLESRMAMIDQLMTNATEAATLTKTMQDALGAVNDRGAGLASTLALSTTGFDARAIDTGGAEASRVLDATISHLNSATGGRFVFAGTHSNRPPLTQSAQMLDRLQGVVAGLTTAAQITDAVAAWFDAAPGAGGFVDTDYDGSVGQLVQLKIGPQDSIALRTTPLTPAVRDQLKALASAALIERGVLSGDPAGQRDLLRMAGRALLDNQPALVAEMSRIGLDQQIADRAKTEGAAAMATLTTMRNDIRRADPYQTAAALTEAQAQLETLYTVSARLSDLRLVNFLS